MPLLPFNDYPLPWGHFEGHSQTILPGLTRQIKSVTYQRVRISTPDDDFLDLDWSEVGSDRLLVVTHGLEGSTDSQYVRGITRLFNQHGWDVLAWNCRSCSGEMNRQFRLYHHGEIEDIGWVVRHALAQGRYRYLGMSGFSMGANMTLKYLSVHGERAPAEIIGAAVFSAPCDLAEGAEVLDRPGNWLYKKRFLDRLAEKIRIKDTLFPGRIDVQQLRAVRRWRDFDEWFSAPMCGYENAAAFYRDASPKYFMEGIRIPVLLASALNDPILTPGCMPVELAKNHPFLHLEMPTKGGHCGFMIKNSPHSWAELRALEWLGQLI